VLFVVPRLFGDETERNVLLINAGAVDSVEKKEAVSKATSRGNGQTFKTPSVVTRRSGMTYIQVPAAFSPYERPAVDRHSSLREKLSGYAIGASDDQDVQHESSADIDVTEKHDTEEDIVAFSGTYGANLMNEVTRYAAVAGRLAKKYSFDVIHAHDWMTFLAGITASRKSKKPLVIHVHSTEYDRAGGHVNQEVVRVEKLGFTEADHIIAVSNWTKNILVSRYLISEDKIQVVHNGVLPKAEPEKFLFPGIGSHFITFLGRVTHQKGPRYFVEAAQKVLQEFPEAHFIVAGVGDLLPQIIERVAQLNMSSQFHFTGFLSGNQVDQIWSLTDVYVMPSVSEPFGIAPLEAIQGGVPVILSNQSGVSEVMPHAIKVDFWDVKALAAAICSVLRYESLSHVLRQNSKQHIQRLTWDKAAGEIKTLYHELSGKK
jgi:glycosyltransferase involved in cell wall biosynthesis